MKEIIENYHTNNNLPEWKRIDAVCVISKGVICNIKKDDKIIFLPDQNSHIKEFYTQKGLMVFYGLLSNLFVAALPNFVALEYIRKFPI